MEIRDKETERLVKYFEELEFEKTKTEQRFSCIKCKSIWIYGCYKKCPNCLAT